MNAYWKIGNLSEVARIYSGYAFKSSILSKEKGIPVLKIANIQNRQVLKECPTFLPEESFTEKLKRFVYDKNDILVAMTGAGSVGKVGKMRIVDRLYLVNQRVGIIKVNNEKADPEFIYHILATKEYENILYQLGLGAGQPNVSPTDVGNLEIPLPSLSIQKKIAGILSNYDDLIENNTRFIKILEEMAQRIYREWFVYFRYPGHESDKLVESDLGIIPVGWEVKKLRECVLNVRQSERAGDHLLSIPYVPIDCIPRKSLFLNSAKPGSEAKSSLISFQKYDVLFGAMRSYFHKVVISPFNGTTRKTCFVLRPIDPGHYAFTVLTLFQESTINFANSHSRGSTMPYAVWDDGLAEMPSIYPSKEVALNFNKIVEPMLKRIALGFFEQKNLRQARDFLLPKLISGKIDVSELDIDIGESR